jgi:hypothetical protein
LLQPSANQQEAHAEAPAEHSYFPRRKAAHENTRAMKEIQHTCTIAWNAEAPYEAADDWPW